MDGSVAESTFWRADIPENNTPAGVKFVSLCSKQELIQWQFIS